MLTKYKNEIFKHLRHGGLTPKDFSFRELLNDEKYQYYDLGFLENGATTDFFFEIRRLKTEFNQFDCAYKMYSATLKWRKYSEKGVLFNIDTLCYVLAQWMEYNILPYLNDKAEPDLWEEYLKAAANDQQRIDLTATDEFTYDEKQQLRIGLQALNINIKQNFSLTNEQLKLVNDGIKYLSEGVDRLNKVDWRTILIGQFFTIATAIGTTNPHAYSALWDMFMKVIQVVHFLPAP